jgi:hypothetical protein
MPALPGGSLVRNQWLVGLAAVSRLRACVPSTGARASPFGSKKTHCRRQRSGRCACKRLGRGKRTRCRTLEFAFLRAINAHKPVALDLQNGIARIDRSDVCRFSRPQNDSIGRIWLLVSRFSPVGFGRTRKPPLSVGAQGEEGVTVSPSSERADFATSGNRTGLNAVVPAERPFLRRNMRVSERTTTVDRL